MGGEPLLGRARRPGAPRRPRPARVLVGQVGGRRRGRGRPAVVAAAAPAAVGGLGARPPAAHRPAGRAGRGRPCPSRLAGSRHDRHRAPRRRRRHDPGPHRGGPGRRAARAAAPRLPGRPADVGAAGRRARGRRSPRAGPGPARLRRQRPADRRGRLPPAAAGGRRRRAAPRPGPLARRRGGPRLGRGAGLGRGRRRTRRWWTGWSSSPSGTRAARASAGLAQQVKGSYILAFLVPGLAERLLPLGGWWWLRRAWGGRDPRAGTGSGAAGRSPSPGRAP